MPRHSIKEDKGIAWWQVGEDLRILRNAAHLTQEQVKLFKGFNTFSIGDAERGYHPVDQSATGMRYALWLYDAAKGMTNIPVPYLEYFIADLVRNDVYDLDMNSVEECMNISQFALYCGVSSGIEELCDVARAQMKRFREVHFRTDVNGMAAILGCTRQTIKNIEEGTTTMLNSPVAIRYILRIAPKLASLLPTYILDNYFELYLIMRELRVPWGFEASARSYLPKGYEWRAL